MRKAILLIWIFILSNVYGQDVVTQTGPLVLPKFQWGIKAGATRSNVTVDWSRLSELPKQQWGYQLGIVTRYNAMDWMNLNAYLDFVQKGFVIPDRLPSDSDIRERVEAFGNLFQLSFDARFEVFEGFGLNVGPYLSYWQSGKATVEISGDSIATQTDVFEVQGVSAGMDAASVGGDVLLINPWDYGITGGLSYDFAGKWSLSVKYELGLADLNNMAAGLKDKSLFAFDADGHHSVNLPPTRFRTLTLTLIYWFH